MMRYRCPCCGYYTFLEEPRGNYDICPVCYWEDDPIQSRDPDYEGGANTVSLNMARENYKNYGACDEKCIKYVRKPNADELHK